MQSWKTPQVLEVPVGLEIGAYAPAELDEPPRPAKVEAGSASAPREGSTVGRGATDPDPSTLS